MSEAAAIAQRKWGLVDLFRWALLIFALWFTFSQWAQSKNEESEEIPVTESTLKEGPNGLAADLRPLRVGPGGGFLVDIRDRSGQPRPEEIQEVTLDGAPLRATTLIDGRRIFRVPDNAPLGRRSVEVHLRDQSALATGIEVTQANQRKIVRNIVGGLALLLYGLRIFSKGLRRVASRRLQRGVERLTHRRLGSMTAGLCLGPMAQTGASAVGLVYGFVENRLIRPVAALWLLWGALISLSASAALLPFVSFREALIFVGVGVAWLMSARTRRQRALAQVLLGGGLLFHGVHLTRIGFASLISNPELLSYASFLQTDTLGGWFMCWLTGLVLAALFQGPGALVVLVLGLLEALGLVGVPGALAMLAGAFVGTPLSALALSWPFGPQERRIVGMITGMSLLASLFLLFAQPVLLVLLDPLIEGDPNLAIWGKKQILPYAASHLVAAHLVAIALLVGVSSLLATAPRWLLSARGGSAMDATMTFERWIYPVKGPSANDTPSLRRELLVVLAELKAALPEFLRMTAQGERTLGSVIDSRVSNIREASRAMLRPVRAGASESAIMESVIPSPYLRSTALTLFHIEHGLDSLRQMSDTFIERGEALRDLDKETLERVCGLLDESIDEIVECVREQVEIDLESIQSREIKMNAVELEHRRQLYSQGNRMSLRGEVLTSELVSGLENMGNQIYRLVQSLDGMPFSDSEEG